MADAKITALTALTDPILADLLPIVDDVAGTPITKKITLSSLSELLSTNSIFQQAVVNANFEVDQQGGTYTSVGGRNNDDVYVFDVWNIISDGNDTFDISQEAVTDLPGSSTAIKLDVETAKRGGLVQFWEAKDAQKFKGKNVSVSFAVKSANIAAIRCAVLSWGSTADAITSDVVGTWGATPTWATNWTAENTPADLTVTSGWTTVKIENIPIDSATVNNLALAIWLPNEETIGDIIYISQVKMSVTGSSLLFQPKSFAQEMLSCLSVYENSYPYGTLPGTSLFTSGYMQDGYPTIGHPLFYSLPYAGANSTRKLSQFAFKVRKRAVPTFRYWDGAGNLTKCCTVNQGQGFTANNIFETYQGCAGDRDTVHFNTGADTPGWVIWWEADARL